jgi:hypothetical protein
MKISIVSLVLVSIFLFACKKENNSGGNTPPPPPPPPPPVVDTALVNFVGATGITDAQLKMNLDSLITRAKRHGWWALCKVIYPMAGGTEASCKYNLKDPSDADASFRLTFNGGTWTYSNAAANPGATGYAYTYFNPAVQIADTNSCHMSIYSANDLAGGTDNADIGAYDDSTGLGFYLSARDMWPDSSGKPFAAISHSSFQGASVNGSGFFMLSKTSPTTAILYRGASVEGGDSTMVIGALPNLNLFLCNQNFTGSAEPYANGFSQRGLSFVTIGSGISADVEALMYADITAFVESK